MDVQQRLREYSALTEAALQTYLSAPEQVAYWHLHDGRLETAAAACKYETIYHAAAYSAFAGGKRLRPALLLEFCRICGGDVQAAAPFAAALEMIHTYSLIHDDLPCMDNDDFRRGKPTSHKRYGEGIAVLAGDALLNRAFETMLDAVHTTAFSPQAILQCASVLSRASGMDGMIGGQIMDLEAEGHHVPLEELVLLQELKTGALIRAAAMMGCILAGRTDAQTLRAAEDYGNAIGLAFQIQDDLLDLEGDSEKVGKTLGKDLQSEKSTFPSLLGMEKCKDLVQELTQSAKEAAKHFDDFVFLHLLAEQLSTRDC